MEKIKRGKGERLASESFGGDGPGFSATGVRGDVRQKRSGIVGLAMKGEGRVIVPSVSNRNEDPDAFRLDLGLQDPYAALRVHYFGTKERERTDFV